MVLVQRRGKRLKKLGSILALQVQGINGCFHGVVWKMPGGGTSCIGFTTEDSKKVFYFDSMDTCWIAIVFLVMYHIERSILTSKGLTPLWVMDIYPTTTSSALCFQIILSLTHFLFCLPAHCHSIWNLQSMHFTQSAKCSSTDIPEHNGNRKKSLLLPMSMSFGGGRWGGYILVFGTCLGKQVHWDENIYLGGCIATWL